MEPKISVIIPVYNVSEFVAKCIESCINQTFRDIEIIVVNDGSPDDSGIIIEKYAGMDKRIVPVFKENEGLLLARLTGCSVAKGEYIFFLDGDDFLPEDALEVLYDAAKANDLDYVMGEFHIVKKGEMEYCKYGKTESVFSGKDFFFYLLNCGWNICGKLIRRSLCNNLIIKPISMGEDLFLNMQIVPKAKKAMAVYHSVYCYVMHDKSMTASTDEERNKFLNLQMTDSVLALVNELDYDQKMKYRIYYIFRNYLIYCMKKRIQEIRPILMKHIWSKKEARSIIFHYGKLYYALLAISVYMPKFTYAVLNIFERLNLIVIVRKCKLHKI
ncbi:glycosyltransferase family 2 protein [Parabacteroides sp.]